MTSTVDQQEIQAFSNDAKDWWNPKGPFAPLHRLNPLRMGYIRGQICDHFGLDHHNLKPFKGLKILDVGCGGGLVCEPLARLGGTVTGIDADPVAIDVAKDHGKASGLSITYLNEDSIEHGNPSPYPSPSGRGNYDIITALEIIEHVTDPAAFIASLQKLLKPEGILIISTLNRTAKSYALGIVAAEYILGWVPKGTHDWKKFVKPSELAGYLRQNNLKPTETSGLIFNPLRGEFALSKTDLDVNYFMTAKSPC
jgi:2-polyprenyl-6-hydroxyphenyl methylase/3-demethylubiquinone-9 3-methyltransferase